jgi:hypothetical protein
MATCTHLESIELIGPPEDVAGCTAHYTATRHPVMRSAMPGEGWRWCYIDEVSA